MRPSASWKGVEGSEEEEEEAGDGMVGGEVLNARSQSDAGSGWSGVMGSNAGSARTARARRSSGPSARSMGEGLYEDTGEENGDRESGEDVDATIYASELLVRGRGRIRVPVVWERRGRLIKAIVR